MPDPTTDHDEDVVEGGLGVGAYRAARTRAEESVVRAAFADLDSRVRAEVVPPPARTITDRARRRQVVTARRRVGFAAAAAVVLLGGAVAVHDGLRRDGGTADVAVQTPAPGRTTVPTTPATLPPSTVPAAVTTSAPTRRTRTVVVTVPADPTTTARTTPTRTRTAAPTTSVAPPPPAPSTEVTVYLWQGTLYPTCTTQYAVKRTIPGTGGWKAAVEAALAGTTAQERKDGYVSPFGSGVQATVDEANRRVDFASTSGFADIPPACRTSLEQLVTRTAAENGSGVTVTLRGSVLLWANWKAGLL